MEEPETIFSDCDVQSLTKLKNCCPFFGIRNLLCIPTIDGGIGIWNRVLERDLEKKMSRDEPGFGRVSRRDGGDDVMFHLEIEYTL